MKGKRPAFFKFFSPETCIDQLEIPSQFNQSVQGVLPNKVHLRDGYNNLWQVKVEKFRNKFYFTDGWTDFVADNFIEGEDIIFFQYSRDGLFDTKIHGKDCCEKEGVGGYRVTMEQPMVSKEDDEETDDEVRTEDDEGKDEHDDYEHEISGDEFDEEIPANNSAMKQKQGTSSSTIVKAKRIRRVSDIYSRDGLFDTKIHGKDACEKEGVGGYRTKEQPMVSKEDDEENDDEEDDVETEDDEGKYEYDDNDMEHEIDGDELEEEIHANNSAMKKKQGTSSSTTVKAKRIRRVSDIYGAEFFRHASIPMPGNPYFVTKINEKRRGELYIPKDVIRDNNLDLPYEIAMYDPTGRKWIAKGQKRRDARRYYTTGWRSLCRRNLIADDDVCIIEFIKRRGRLTMDVSIIRAPVVMCSCQAHAKNG